MAPRSRPSHKTTHRRTSPPSMMRRKNVRSGLRKVPRNGPKPRPHSDQRTSLFAGFENKLVGVGAPPKFDRASLDTLRDDRAHTIPALRVRFTAEHLRDVIERMAEQQKGKGGVYGQG